MISVITTSPSGSGAASTGALVPSPASEPELDPPEPPLAEASSSTSSDAVPRPLQALVTRSPTKGQDRRPVGIRRKLACSPRQGQAPGVVVQPRAGVAAKRGLSGIVIDANE